MKNLLLVFGVSGALVFAAAGCKTIQYVPIEHTEYVTVRDTTVIRDTTIQYQIEKQYVRDYTGLLDTLRLSTDYAEAEAHVDTTNRVLTGSIKNRDRVLNIPTQYKERVVYRDSIITKEVPVPVEVPKPYVPMFWIVCSVIGLGAVAFLFLWLISKF